MRGSLKEAIPMTDAQFGLLTTVFLVVYALLSPIAGFLADRTSRSRVILGSLFIWSVLTWLTGHAKTYEQLLVARALMGASEAAYIPAALALIADYHRSTTRSLATGVHMTGISIGSGLGGLGGWLAGGATRVEFCVQPFWHRRHRLFHRARVPIARCARRCYGNFRFAGLASEAPLRRSPGEPLPPQFLHSPDRFLEFAWTHRLGAGGLDANVFG